MFRLLILIFLFYLFYRTLGNKRNRSQERRVVDPARHDILIEDPVCHTYVPKSQAFSLDHGEKIYYFCSRKCRDAYCRKEEKTS